MNKGIKGIQAAALAAVLFCAGHAAAAQHTEGTTIVRERGTAEENIRKRVADIIGTQAQPQNHVFSHGSTYVMRRWDMTTQDTGGTLLFSDSPE